MYKEVEAELKTNKKEKKKIYASWFLLSPSSSFFSLKVKLTDSSSFCMYAYMYVSMYVCFIFILTIDFCIRYFQNFISHSLVLK